MLKGNWTMSSCWMESCTPQTSQWGNQCLFPDVQCMSRPYKYGEKKTKKTFFFSFSLCDGPLQTAAWLCWLTDALSGAFRAAHLGFHFYQLFKHFLLHKTAIKISVYLFICLLSNQDMNQTEAQNWTPEQYRAMQPSSAWFPICIIFNVPNSLCSCQDHNLPSSHLPLHCFRLYHASAVQTKQVIVIRGNASMYESHTVPFPGPS